MLWLLIVAAVQDVGACWLVLRNVTLLEQEGLQQGRLLGALVHAQEQPIQVGVLQKEVQEQRPRRRPDPEQQRTWTEFADIPGAELLLASRLLQPSAT